MKRSLYLCLILTSLLLMTGCAVTIMKNPWPGATGAKWYVPEYFYSQEEAQSILRSLSGGGFANGYRISGIDVDKYTMLINMKWQEIHSQTDYVPSYGGFFVGWNYIPVYSGSYQTSTATLEKNKNINIDFKNIKDIQIVGNSVYLFEPGKTTVLNCANTVSPQKTADAARSMMRLHDVSLGTSFGFSFARTNEAQEKYAGAGGIYAAQVFSGGPAEKAGLKPSNIILEINSKKITTPQECADALKKAAASGRKTDLLVLHTETPEYTDKILWEKRLISITPITR